jgi:WD40 repeat protein
MSGQCVCLDERFSPDGKYLAMTGSVNDVRPHYIGPRNTDQVAIIWDVDQGQILRTIKVGDMRSGTEAKAIAFSPDGSEIAIGASSYTGDDHIEVWDVATGTQITRYPSVKGRGLNALDWSPRDSVIAAVYEDNKLRFWDSGSAALVNEVGLDGWPHAVAFSPDGAEIAYNEHRTVVVRAVKK